MENKVSFASYLTERGMVLMTIGLALAGIPFDPYCKKGPLGEIQYNIKFPWAPKCDIAVSSYGTLHALDEDEEDYPFAETYGFPWDYDDITCFDLRNKDDLKELFSQLSDLYRQKMKQ